MGNNPTDTATFLFTDIEGSNKLAQEYPDRWEDLRVKQHAILQAELEAHKGHVFQITGDAFCVAFHTAINGLNAAIDTQPGLNSFKNKGHSRHSDQTPFAKIKPN